MRFLSSLKNQLGLMIVVIIIPLLSMVMYLLVSLLNYNGVYDEIISNVTIANSYNLAFKEKMDESTYKLVVGAVTFENIDEEDSLQNPYQMMNDLRADVNRLMQFTTDKESYAWTQSLLRNLETLENRMDELKLNIEEGGHYDENIVILDTDIYILTELIQDDMQHYIYYQAQSITALQKNLNEQIRQFIFIVSAITCVLLVIVAGIAIYIIRGITNPIEKLTGVTQKIAKGDFEVRASEVKTEEINSLSNAVNYMAENLEIFVGKIKEDEQKMRVAELRILQEQINPHFLYNTLDTIMWLIEDGKAGEAEKMVESLSNFFRIVLSKGKEYITIEEEKNHIQNYLSIQQIRYQDILEYEIDIPEELYKYTILKLTLQPLVENALYHGIKYKRAKGKIKVSGYIDHNVITLSVKDDGVGMDTATTKNGFGTTNVNERIKMNYGEEFGLTITSKLGEGTLAEVTIPARLPEM